jgi:maltokinase
VAPWSGQGSAALSMLLVGWLPEQRWFAAKGSGEVEVTADHGPRLVDPAGQVGIRIHLVTSRSADGSTATYQVPLTYRPEPEPTLSGALVGVLDRADGERRWVYDGPFDPVFVTAWTHLIASGGEVRTDTGRPSRVRGVRQPGAHPPDTRRPGHVLHGEQSNTSVIVAEPDDPAPVIVKLFRQVQAGRNPDIVVPAALTQAGCERVPRQVGWVEAEWTEADGSTAWGHLASMVEFLRGSEDAWRMACRAVTADESFRAQAQALGAATAEVHATLAEVLPTRPVGPGDLAATAGRLQERLAWAVAAVPALAGCRDGAAAALAAVADVGSAPDLQVVHGDLHLGQVLHSSHRGWVLLDFEGEPLRPLAERNELDLALRDVAGMLRSFDYAARHSVLGAPDDDPRAVAAAAWVAECRAAFLTGYAEVSGRDPQQDAVLLRALELDKAVYEAVYETRHRPDWIEVPLRAVERLLSLPQTSA